jgi:hypothetical protein
MHWRCGSSHTAPTLQVQSPEFKLQSHQKINFKRFIKIIIENVVGFKALKKKIHDYKDASSPK